MVDLYSKVRRMQTFTLPHEHYCRNLGVCRCSRQTVKTVLHNGKTGKKTPTKKTVQVPASLSVPALGKAENQPDAVLKVPELQDAIRSGRILPKVREVRQVDRQVEESPKKSKTKGRGSKKKK